MRWSSLILLLIVLAFAFVLGRRTAPIRTVERVRTDTIYAERLLPAETVRVAVPVERVIYRERVRTRTDTVRVPVEVERYVISRPAPIRTDPGRCVWTYFEPISGRWEQAVYSVPPQAAGYSLHAALGRALVADAWHWYAGVEAEARYRRVSTFLRASTLGLSAGIRLRVWP